MPGLVRPFNVDDHVSNVASSFAGDSKEQYRTNQSTFDNVWYYGV